MKIKAFCSRKRSAERAARDTPGFRLYNKHRRVLLGHHRGGHHRGVIAIFTIIFLSKTMKNRYIEIWGVIASS